MTEYIGNIAIPEITPSGTFPVISDYGYGLASAPEVVEHQFGSANAKITQRFLLGTGAKHFTVRRASMREADRIAVRDFWETQYGPYGAFTYNAPNDDGVGTTPYIVRFANEPLSWQFLSDQISSIGVTLIEISTGIALADRILEVAVTANHYVYQYTPTLTDNGQNISSIYLKAAGRYRAYILFCDKTGGGKALNVDLSTGGYGGGSDPGGIIACGNGWYRCWVNSPSMTGANAPYVMVYILDDAGNLNHAGDITKGIYISGGQFQKDQTTLADYVKTEGSPVGVNSFLYSEDFTQSDWGKANLAFSGPTHHTLNSTLTRFPSSALKTALLSQVQEIIPLVKIVVREVGYDVIYVSDRRCTVGTQLYLPRLLDFDGISQSIGNESDQASFVFGNADRVMRDLANDTDLFRASIEFSLYHVGTGIKLDVWKGEIVDWQMDSGPECRVTAADGIYELNLPYPTRRISRTCWKCFDNGHGCPYTAYSTGMDYTHFPTADPTKCDKSYDSANGCLAHGMKHYFGGILAEPQGVTVKDNSTGLWGYGRSMLTSVSIISESIYDEIVPEIYTDTDMPVNCKVAAGREESDYYDALGIVGEGPITLAAVGHQLDAQYNHGYPGQAGLRSVNGSDPATGTYDTFSLGQAGGAGGDWRKNETGGKDNFAAGTAFLELRRQDTKGLQLSRPGDHAMKAIVSQGLSGWIWSAPGTRTWGNLTNPVWIIVNALLRAKGLRYADATTAEQYFVVADATAAAGICNDSVTKIVGSGSETQFKFRGLLQEEKPLRDWIQEILMNCLGYYSFDFGKLSIGIRENSSVEEAFTVGNILFGSLQLSALKPTFNHLTANFADEEFEFVANSVTVYDIDHAKLIGGVTAPLFLKSNMNLSGCSSKSQAARIISTRLREELGGITENQWRRARQLGYKTTVLALNTKSGKVCSMTHEDMPDGFLNGDPIPNYGEFLCTGWRLNKDYSIDVSGRTTVDEMYDLVTGPKPADVVANPVPQEPANEVRSVSSVTAQELFVQDDVNADLYHRKIKALFVPPPTSYELTFSTKTVIHSLAIATTGGVITGNKIRFIEVIPVKSGVEGLPSLPVYVSIPAGTNTNKISFTVYLPPEADHYRVRIGNFPGLLYEIYEGAYTDGVEDVVITDDVTGLDSTSLSPDPHYHHAHIFYRYGSGELRDGGATAGPTDTYLIFEPEAPQSVDTYITVYVRGSNLNESDMYPLANSPGATLTLTKDSGNPSGCSALAWIDENFVGNHPVTGVPRVAAPKGKMVWEFDRDTLNYSSIYAAQIVVSAADPGFGPYAAQRAAYTAHVHESGSGLAIEAGQKVITLGGTIATSRTGKVFLIHGTGDAALDGNVIALHTAGSAVINLSTPFNKSGSYSWVIIDRYYEGGAESSNVWSETFWFPRDFVNNSIHDATWRTRPQEIIVGAFYSAVFTRNKYGVSL